MVRHALTHICGNVGPHLYRERDVSRLTIDIPEQLHQSLKARAALQGKTMKQYALERLWPNNTEDAQAWAELQATLGERITAGLAGKVSSKGIGEILDEEVPAGKRA